MLTMFQYLLLLAAGFVSLLPSCAAVDFYVQQTNSTNQTCSGQPCYTLDQYAQNTSLFQNQSNISLLFLTGNHSLTQELNIDNRDEVVIKNWSVDDEKVVIYMQADFHVTNVNVFEVYNITIAGKTTTSFYPYTVYVTGAETITQYQVETENIHLEIDNNSTEGQTVSITKCNYSSTTGFHLLWFTAHSDSAEMIVKIQSTKISNNAIKSTGITFVGSALSFDCFYQTQNYESPFLTVDIQDSDIRGWEDGIVSYCSINNLAIERASITDNNNGVSISLTKVNNLAVKNTLFINNQISGINLIYTEVENFTVQDTHFENNGIKGTLAFAGGIIVNGYNNTVKNLTLKDTIFESNQPYGVVISGTNKIATIIKDTIIRDCQFGITFTLYTKQPGNVLSCDNCIIASNYGTGIALTNIQDKVIIHNSRFYNNKGTPITAYESQIELIGETIFENNTAIRGGGLSLINSYVYFANNSNITFRNNSAKEFGGAIYIVSRRYAVQTSFRYLITDRQHDQVLTQIPCFYQVSVNTGGTTFEIQVNFINNKAKLGGHAIYGAPLNAQATCSNINGGYPLQNILFNFEETADKSSNLSLIASDPLRVCFCDNGIPQCENTTIVYNETSYPGENFNISLALVGYNYGTVTGLIYANLLSSGHHGWLGRKQHIQAADYSSCNTLGYSIHSYLTKPFDVIKLTANEQEISEDDIEQSNKIAASCKTCNIFTGCTTLKPCPALLTISIYINVTLANCPLGFKLENGRCECDKNTKINTTCQISDHTGYIYRQGTVWVGVDQTSSFCSNTNNTYYLSYEQCPNGYCKNERTAVNLLDPDSQCSNNHAGNLCGRCKTNHSLVLGSDRCFDCHDNNGLALLIFFTAAGFLLVFFIKFLDLTVAHGTINGLIFYANVVWSYNSILFPVHGNTVNRTAEYNSTLNYYNILRASIAWINLDFGVETCFLQGLDANTKTWLQFVFPIYIWCIAGFIILLCHYSFKATKLFGNNAISVLATLFLLSYSKLLRTITNTFMYANLQYSNCNDTLSVWAFDGSIKYWGLSHWPLFLAGLACFIGLWLPYTLTVLLVPCLKKWDQFKFLQWINKLKPFYDSYYGPFRVDIYCQCWVGALLIVRGMVVVVLISTSTNNPIANILFLVVITTALLMYNSMVGRQYRKWYVSLLENLYILNLGILAGAFLFTQPNAQSNTNNKETAINPAIVVSASLALLQFACIVIFHFVRQCRDIVCKCRRGKRREIIKEQPNPPLPQTNDKNLDRSHYNSSRLRESIMESSFYDQRLI